MREKKTSDEASKSRAAQPAARPPTAVEAIQRLQATAGNRVVTQLMKGSAGGLPPQLRAGIERLSGVSMADVRVHYSSPEPAQYGALAFARGSSIHLAPGQERHLPHEAWHTVQQKQGRVRPTMAVAGAPVNDDARLEREADVMGGRALRG